jgi:pimeloyl-ACP methyl ester carboxylesterase
MDCWGFGQIRLGQIRISNFRHIHTAIAERGHPVVMESVHPTASIQRRARMLKRSIESSLDRMGQSGERVIVFAHSMGGLDARYMISQLNMADRVAALVTVCTPHRGSPYADWAIRNLGQRMGGFRLAQRLDLDVNALQDLTAESCSVFNEQTPDMPGVRYTRSARLGPGIGCHRSTTIRTRSSRRRKVTMTAWFRYRVRNGEPIWAPGRWIICMRPIGDWCWKCAIALAM